MQRARLTFVLSLLCVPAILAAASILPWLAMKPDAGAMQIPLVRELYQISLRHDGEPFQSYAIPEGTVLQEGQLSDVLEPAQILLDALPSDLAGLLDYTMDRSIRSRVDGTEVGMGFFRWNAQFYVNSSYSFADLSVVVAPDGSTPVLMNFYINGAYPMEPPAPLEDPFGTLQDLTEVLGLDALDWQPEQQYSSNDWWCIRSESAHLNQVLHLRVVGSYSYFLDIALSSVP